jgi:Putative transposase
MIAIAADPKHLGARIGVISVLHTWGSALTHHPHIHMIAPGGGVSLDGLRWVACRPGFFLSVRVLSRLFRRLFLEKLMVAFDTGRLQFFGALADLAARNAFMACLAPLRTTEWVVYAKRPFGGPEAVLAYVACYTHRLAISNSRLIALHDNAVAFKWKDYRIEGRERYKTMTLATGEFIRRFLMHVLPSGFHRIRHYGLFASGVRIQNIARAHELLTASDQPDHNSGINDGGKVEPASPSHSCPCCGGRMIVIETFEFGRAPRSFSANEVWIDTS